VKFIPPVQRKEATAFGRPYHFYVDGDNKRIPGVTTIINNGIPKPKLINWAGRATAEYAIDNWDELTNLTPAKRLKTLEGGRYEASNKAKDKGTQVHLYAEALVQGLKVEGPPDELRPYIDNYVKFIDQAALDPIQVEVVVVNYTRGYAGTLDLIAELTMPGGERETWLLDIKTGETGIYPETALQLAAYRNAEFYIDQNGNEAPMITVGGCAAIHVTADDAVMIPVADSYTIGDANRSCFDTFRLAGMVADFMDTDAIIKPALQWPTASTAHVIWDSDD